MGNINEDLFKLQKKKKVPKVPIIIKKVTEMILNIYFKKLFWGIHYEHITPNLEEDLTLEISINFRENDTTHERL